MAGRARAADGAAGAVGGGEDQARPRGRRPAGSDTRGEIVAAARAELAQRGYDGASVRSVARRAGVDPALVRHYFEDKAELFAAAMVPTGVEPAQVVGRLLEGGLDGLGERLALAVLEVWEDERSERFRVLFGALGSSEPHVQAMAQFLGRQVFARVVAGLPTPDADLRMALAASHVVGVLIARHVLQLPEIAGMGTDRLAALVGPALQGYLTGPLTEPPGDVRSPGRPRGPLAGADAEEDYSSYEE